LVLVLLALPLVVVSEVELGDELDELGIVLLELGVLELELLLDGVLEEPLLIEALPLTEPDGVALVVELGVAELDVSVPVELDELDEAGGVLGVTSVVVELEEVLGVVLAPVLLRSQPVTAAVATARTATRGMSLFMTSPFQCGCRVGRSLTGPEVRFISRDTRRTTRAKRVSP
jgi:hypothetical protein